MPELDPFDARLTAAVHAFADRAATDVDAAAMAERAVGRRRAGAFAWLGPRCRSPRGSSCSAGCCWPRCSARR